MIEKIVDRDLLDELAAQLNDAWGAARCLYIFMHTPDGEGCMEDLKGGMGCLSRQLADICEKFDELCDAGGHAAGEKTAPTLTGETRGR